MKPTRALIVLLALAAACGHSDPYALRDFQTPNAPAPIGALDQLTFSVDGDFAPAWLVGDSVLAYSRVVDAPVPGDRCLAFYPLAMRRVPHTRCWFNAVNAVRSSAESPGGRIAFAGQDNTPGARLGDRAIYVFDAADTVPPTRVLSIPFATSQNDPVTDVEQPAWLNDQALVFIAVEMRPVVSDMESFPLAIDLLDLSGAQPVRTEIPGSARPTSVTVDPADGTLYATFVNDSVIYALDPVTGQRTAARNFGALIPRDVRVASRRVAAVVAGKRITLLPSGAIDSIDQGGQLAYASLDDTLPPTLVPGQGVVNLAPPTGFDSLSRWFRHLTLSRDGKQLVAEGFPVLYHRNCPLFCTVIDTTVTKISDLFLARLP